MTSQQDNEILECTLCGRRTTRLEAESRNFNTGSCSEHIAELVPVASQQDTELLQDLLRSFLRETNNLNGIGNPFDETIEALTSWKDKEVEASEQKHIENYKWLFGLSGDFPQSEPGKRYNWRSELRKRLSPSVLESLQSQGGK